MQMTKVPRALLQSAWVAAMGVVLVIGGLVANTVFQTQPNALVRVTALAFISSVAATMALCSLYGLSKIRAVSVVSEALANRPLLKWAWYASGVAIGLALSMWGLAMVGLVQ